MHCFITAPGVTVFLCLMYNYIFARTQKLEGRSNATVASNIYDQVTSICVMGHESISLQRMLMFTFDLTHKELRSAMLPILLEKGTFQLMSYIAYIPPCVTLCKQILSKRCSKRLAAGVSLPPPAWLLLRLALSFICTNLS